MLLAGKETDAYAELMHTFFDEDNNDEKEEAGPAAGDYTPPSDLPIPGETEAVPEKEL